MTSKPPTTAKPTDSSPQSIKLTTTTATTTTTITKSIMFSCLATESNGIWWPVSMPGIVVRDCPETLKGWLLLEVFIIDHRFYQIANVYLNPAHGEMHSIQHYVIKFVSGLWQVVCFFGVLWFPPPLTLTATV